MKTIDEKFMQRCAEFGRKSAKNGDNFKTCGKMESKQLKIKKLSVADATVYQNLMLQGVAAHPESFRISIEDVRQTTLPFAAEHVDNFTLGAFEDDETLVGVVSFEREQMEKMRHKGLIYRMYVAADQAGKGIGRKLLQAAIERAGKIDGLEQINLTVVASNERALGLYKSAGFVSFSQEKRAIKTGTNYYDEETMVLQLNQN